jgi:hypothetical protein
MRRWKRCTSTSSVFRSRSLEPPTWPKDEANVGRRPYHESRLIEDGGAHPLGDADAIVEHLS